jgi:hypothetical protein
MTDDVPMGQPARRSRIGPALLIAILAFVIGVALMAFAVRDRVGWFSRNGGAAAPVAAPSPQPTAAPPATDGTTLAARQATLAAELANLETRAAGIASDSAGAAARAGRAEAILVAFAARRAVDRGVGLGYLEEQLRQRFGATIPREVTTVIRAARTPVTLEDLRESLDGAAPTLLASRSDWWTGIGSEVRNLVVIHRVGTPSPLPSDRLARARRMLQAGNVEAALGEVARMPGAAQSTNWTTAARRYVDARRALDTIEAAAITGAIAPPAVAAPAPAPAPPQVVPAPAPTDDGDGGLF